MEVFNMTINIDSKSLLYEALEAMKQIYTSKLVTLYRLKAIYYDKENKCIVATDGKRLLTFTLNEGQQEIFNSFDTPFFNYEKGYLIGVYSTDRNDIEHFPRNYYRVIPADDKATNIEIIDKHTIKKGGKGYNWLNYGYAMRYGLFNYELFEKINIEFNEIRYYKKGNSHMAKFTNEYFTFVVMGVWNN